MLPSPQRLTRQQFAELLKNPEIKVVFNTLGTFKYQEQSNSGTVKFTVVTGSKHQKKAVLRNKIRRQVYTLFRNNPYNIKISGILYVSKQSYMFSYQQLKDYFYALLSKIEKNA
jgi:ribonuclease P protein component